MKTGRTVYTITLIVSILSLSVIATNATVPAGGATTDQPGQDKKKLRLAAAASLLTSLDDTAADPVEPVPKPVPGKKTLPPLPLLPEYKPIDHLPTNGSGVGPDTKKHTLVPAAPMAEFTPVDPHEKVPIGPLPELKPIDDDTTKKELVPVGPTPEIHPIDDDTHKKDLVPEGPILPIDPVDPDHPEVVPVEPTPEKKPDCEKCVCECDKFRPLPMPPPAPPAKKKPKRTTGIDVDEHGRTMEDRKNMGYYGGKFGRKPLDQTTFQERVASGYYQGQFGRPG